MAALRKLQRTIKRSNRTIDGKRVDFGRRKRITKNAVVRPGPGARAELARLAAELLLQSGCHIAVVYGFRDKSEIGRMPYTTGRCQLSRDGKGWDGNGRLMPGSGRDAKGVATIDLVVQWDARGNPIQEDRVKLARKDAA